MYRKVSPAMLALLIAGCDAMPAQTAADRITIVPSRATASAAALPVAGAAATAAAPAPQPRAPVRVLSVEESALINTSEMWSEPIARD